MLGYFQASNISLCSFSTFYTIHVEKYSSQAGGHKNIFPVSFNRILYVCICAVFTHAHSKEIVILLSIKFTFLSYH